MSQRGDYRATYSVLFDSDEYKRLSKDGKLLWHGVKHSLGLSGIDVVYDDELAERAGLETHELEPARQELIREGWIQVEGRVHWLINGLRFEPNVTLTNPKHRAGIERHLRGLPKLPIVSRMAIHYGITNPFPTHKDAIQNPSDTHSIGPRFTEPLTFAVAVDGDGDEERARESRAPDQVASLNGGTPDFDGYLPTEGQTERAAELHVDLEAALRKWRGNRKAGGRTPHDLAADFDEWLEREPAFGAGGREPTPLPGSALWDRQPNGSNGAGHGIVKLHQKAPADDSQPIDLEARKAGMAKVAAAIKPPPEPLPSATIEDPDVIQRREAERDRQRALLAASGARDPHREKP